MKHLLDDRARCACAELLLEGDAGDLEERVVREVELDLIERAEPLILRDHRFARRGENRCEFVRAERVELNAHRKASQELGKEAVFDEIFGGGLMRLIVVVAEESDRLRFADV